jgi:hypothetical protein
MKRGFGLGVLLVVLICLSVGAFASVPTVINYQGKLAGPSGAPVADGVYAMQFAIYDVSVGGSALWTETNPNVQVKGGLFSVLLGGVNNIPSTVFSAPNRFFGVTVGTDAEMTPRQQIASVGFAANASLADTATTVPDGAITTAKLLDGAVVSNELALASVNTTNLIDQAVTTAKLADGSVALSKIAAEAWSTWVPIINLSGFTTTSVLRSNYVKTGKTVHFDISVKGNITGPLYVFLFSLPVAAKNTAMYSGGYGAFIIDGAGSGISGSGYIYDSNTIGIKQYNGGQLAWGDDAIISCSGTYEAQ